MDQKLLIGFLILIFSKDIYGWILLVPGTKWCGKGNWADGYNDLGKYKITDSCCRAHDNCDEYIVAGDSKYGLHNDGVYTRLHCKCDVEFYNCLKHSQDYISYGVGKTYFNYLPEQCFDFRHPATCTKYENEWTYNKCIEYSYNTSLPMEWQWFEMEKYQ